MSTSCTFVSILVTISIFSSFSHASTVKAGTASPPPFKKIYAFGDSYTDTGNTHSATGPASFTYVSNPPYGRTFFHHPTNRYSDGRLVIDFVAEKLSLPYLPPYFNTKADKSNGVNFAVAGSTAIEHSFFVKNNITLNITPQSLQTQLNWFRKFLATQGCINSTTTPQQCKAVFDEALIWVGEIGANDYAYTVGSSVARKTIQELAIKRATNFLQVLLNTGAKYVVVQGLPTTGCLTLSMYLSPKDDRDDMGCVGSVNKQSYSHNTIYQAKLQAFRKQFPNAVIVYADYWNAYRTVMKNAGKYGFKELYKVCCGSSGDEYNFNLFGTCGSPASSSCANPSQYINWDGVHLTEGMYKAVSDLFLNGLFTHPPFEYLFFVDSQALLIKGAKSVVVQGLPPIGCLTLSMETFLNVDRDDIGCVGSMNALSYFHNNVYQVRLQDLRKEFPNAVIAYADYWNAYRDVMKNAGNYGFYELYSACCGSGGGTYNLNMLGPCGSLISTSCTNPSQYINWDGVHLTEAMYKAISGLFFTGESIHPSFEHLLNRKTQSMN